jgi:mono/diheme cytochrome c family protein
MRKRLASVIVGISLAGFGIGLAACGGSAYPDGTVQQPISVGTGDEVVDPSGGTASAGATDTTTTTGGAAAGDPAAGKAVFAANCGVCHALKDAATTGAIGPNLDTSAKAKDAAAVAKQVENGMGAMPPFKGTISDADIANVAAYVASVSGK